MEKIYACKLLDGEEVAGSRLGVGVDSLVFGSGNPVVELVLCVIRRLSPGRDVFGVERRGRACAFPGLKGETGGTHVVWLIQDPVTVATRRCHPERQDLLHAMSLSAQYCAQ